MALPRARRIEEKATMLSIEIEMLGALLSSGFATLIYLLVVLSHVDDHQAIIGGQRRPSRREGTSPD